MAQYIIYFNQQWVGDHSAEWFEGRGPLSRAVVQQMKDAGILVFAGGLVEEIELGLGFDEDGNKGQAISTAGQFIGGLTIINVESDDEANKWAAKIAVACGWPQELRKFKS